MRGSVRSVRNVGNEKSLSYYQRANQPGISYDQILGLREIRTRLTYLKAQSFSMEIEPMFVVLLFRLIDTFTFFFSVSLR